eukprot:gene28612-30619_t
MANPWLIVDDLIADVAAMLRDHPHLPLCWGWKNLQDHIGNVHGADLVIPDEVAGIPGAERWELYSAADKDWTIVPCFLCGLTHWKDCTRLRRLWSRYDGAGNETLPANVMLQAPRLTRDFVYEHFSVRSFILHWNDPN